MALVWLWYGFGMALVEPWGGLGGALVEPWWSLRVALGWLCTPESMPSICLVYGFRVALGGFRGFRLQDTFARGRVSAHNENCWLWTIPLKSCDTFPLPPPIHMPRAMNSPRGASFSANMLWLTPCPRFWQLETWQAAAHHL